MKRLEGKPFALLGINADKDRDELKAALKEEGNTWRCWWDRDGPINTAWNVQQFPTIYVLDHRGMIRYKNVLDEALDSLLKEMEAGPEP